MTEQGRETRRGAAALVIARTGVRRGLRSRSLLLMGIVGPLLLGTILALAFGGPGPSFTVGLVDLDRGPLSASIADDLVEGVDSDAVEVVAIPTRREARAALEDGDVDAAIVLPEGYAASLADPAPLPVEVIATAAEPTGAAVGEAIAQAVTSAVDLRRLALSAAVDVAAPTTGELDALESAIAIAEEGPGERFSGALYFGPLAVFLFLGLAGTARGVLRDEKDGVLARIRAAPVSPASIVAGNSGTVVIQGLVAAAVVVVASAWLFGAVWGPPVEVAVVLLAFVLSVAGMLGLVIGVARSELQAESWSNVLAFGFAILGGSFFGGALLPGVFGVIGTLTPNGAAMRALIELGPGERSLTEVWYLIAWMWLLGVGGLAIGARLLQRRWR